MMFSNWFKDNERPFIKDELCEPKVEPPGEIF